MTIPKDLPTFNPDARVPDANKLMKSIEHRLNRGGPKRWGFALFVFPFGRVDEMTPVQYFGNANTEDLTKAIEIVLQQWARDLDEVQEMKAAEPGAGHA